MRECTEFSQFEYNGLVQKPNRIGLLGGTFNPVHNGHLAMADIAYYEFLLGEVVFLPAGDPPHKKNERIAPAQHRLDMIELAIENHPAFSVSTIELCRSGYTYTVDTLEMLCKQNKDAAYYYIIGADTLFELCSWKTFDRVIALTSFICVLRPGIDEAKTKEYAALLNDKYGHRVYIAHDKGPNISSTKVRELAANGRLRNNLVPGKVATYIAQNRVYYQED